MTDWQFLTTAPALASDQVHVWRVDLDLADLRWPALLPLLSDDERAKAERFHFDRHRRRYSVARAALRLLLGSYLHCPPHAIAFSYNAHGKPRLADPQPRLRFNLSHTADVLLAAFALDSEVGIDIERITRTVDDAALGRRWFSARESQALLALATAAQRRDAFFRLWSRKEAYIKARGEGLSHPLQRFSISHDPHAPRFIEHLDEPSEPGRWVIFNLDVDSDYRAALVMENAPWQLKHYRFDVAAAR